MWHRPRGIHSRCRFGRGTVLEELVPEYKKYDKSIFKLQRKADKLRRELNPEYYKEDGTIIKQKPHEKRVWKTSPVYVSVMRMIRILYRKKKAYTATVHAALCNRIIKSADVFRVEAMDFPALAKRAKETRRADTVTTVTKADGTTQEIRKFKRKKRFGKSITSRSPGLFFGYAEKKVQPVRAGYPGYGYPSDESISV